jgi:hypothetical protein
MINHQWIDRLRETDEKKNAKHPENYFMRAGEWSGITYFNYKIFGMK